MKKIILIASIAMFSCTKNEEKTIAIDHAENVKIAKELFVHFNNHNWEKMADLYVENAEFKEPSSAMKLHKKTKSQIVKEYAKLQERFPDVNDSVVAIYPSGKNNVIVEFLATGSISEKQKFQLPICAILTIENGKITKDFTYYDNSQ